MSGSSNNSGARDQLFAGARPSGGAPGAGPSPNNAPGMSAPPSNDWESGRGANYGGAASYGAYEERQLTAEEQEEEDVNGAKQEIRFIKQQDVSSTRNALRVAQQARETGRQTLERLGAQGESIHNTERNLDLASNQNRLAAEKARELKTLNRSMFAVHVSNPFTSSKRIREREEQVKSDAARDRDEREAVRKAAWDTANRQQEVVTGLQKGGAARKAQAGNLANRMKYQFEADSEDEEMEREIENNQEEILDTVKDLKLLAQGMGREVDAQNEHLGRIGGKVDRVDDEIAVNRSRLDRFK